MLLQSILLCFIFCVLGLEIGVLHKGLYGVTGEHTLKCKGVQSWGTIDLLELESGEFKTYYKTDDCSELLYSPDEVYSSAGRQIDLANFFIMTCNHDDDGRCKFLMTGKKDSISVHYNERGGDYFRYECSDTFTFFLDDNYGGHEDSYKNLPFILYGTNPSCNLKVAGGSRKIRYNDVIQGEGSAVFFYGKKLFVNRVIPENEARTGGRIILKTSLSSVGQHKWILLATCVKKYPRQGCSYFKTQFVDKRNIEGFSLSIDDNILSGDWHVEFVAWKLEFRDPIELHVIHRVNHRLNEKHLGALERRVFSVSNDGVDMHVHMLKCVAADEECDKDSTRDVEVTIYGIVDETDVSNLDVQWTAVLCSEFFCDSVKSKCSCLTTANKNRITKVEYRDTKKCSVILMPEEKHHTEICEDLSVEILEIQET